MFYAHIILAKKGPLSRVWLAAHWDKKITKAHVFETNIEKSVSSIMQPKVKLALRTSGHLLLGVVRIYSRKAKYLLADCNEAFVKIKMAFRPGMVDLPEGHREANVNAITLPEVFHDFDTALPELNDIDIEAQFSINQSRADEITMREDYGSLSLSMHDDGFGDMGFEGDSPDLIRGTLDSQLSEQLFQAEIENAAEANIDNVTLNEAELSGARLDNDTFVDDFGQPELFEGDLFGESHIEKVAEKPDALQLTVEEPYGADVDHFDSAAPASPLSSGVPSPASPFKNDEADETLKNELNDETPNNDVVPDMPHNQSTLLQNEEESFALAPIDATAYKGITKNKRKRKLIVDEVKNISGEEMKSQLANTSDIVTTLDLAPPTKRLMYWKETGGVEKLFSLPTRTIPARVMFANYQRHLTSRFTQLEDFSCLGPSDLLALDNIQSENDGPSIIPKKGGKKRKQDINADFTLQSLPAPDQIREKEHSSVLQTPLDVRAASLDGIVQTHDATIYDNNNSPQPMFSINEMNNIDQITSLNDIPFTPGNLHHGIDDDFNQGNLTPADLNHGRLTPHQSTMESIESIPHLPSEQISHIFNEAENMPANSDFTQITNLSRTCEIASDWNDYELPPSVGNQHTNEEQMENETDEQFEERVLNKRAAQLFYSVKTRLLNQDCIHMKDLTQKNSRKQAAQKFYSLLVLKKFRALEVVQTEAYGDITVHRGPLFDNPKL